MNHRSTYMLVTFLLLFAGRAFAADSIYDPLAVPDGVEFAIHDLTVIDKGRDREIPIRVYLPAEQNPAPVVLFSHGLGGSREGNAFMGKHWSARGYVVVFLQHPGSDTSVWKGKPPGQRMAAMRQAAGLENFLLRARDVPAVLDELERWNHVDGHVLTQRLDMNKVGMSGHSFGAVTTQAVSGQKIGRGRGRMSFTDLRIKAAMVFSPSSPPRGDPGEAFGHVQIPWMLMTGTNDVVPIGNADMASRLAVFPALPAGGKYELVLYKAEHSAFTDRALAWDTQQRNPNHHRVVLALGTAFWDAYLRGDLAAKAWLDGEGPSAVLEKDDRWQTK